MNQISDIRYCINHPKIRAEKSLIDQKLAIKSICMECSTLGNIPVSDCSSIYDLDKLKAGKLILILEESFNNIKNKRSEVSSNLQDQISSVIKTLEQLVHEWFNHLSKFAYPDNMENDTLANAKNFLDRWIQNDQNSDLFECLTLLHKYKLELNKAKDREHRIIEDNLIPISQHIINDISELINKYKLNILSVVSMPKKGEIPNSKENKDLISTQTKLNVQEIKDMLTTNHKELLSKLDTLTQNHPHQILDINHDTILTIRSTKLQENINECLKTSVKELHNLYNTSLEDHKSRLYQELKNINEQNIKSIKAIRENDSSKPCILQDILSQKLTENEALFKEIRSVILSQNCSLQQRILLSEGGVKLSPLDYSFHESHEVLENEKGVEIKIKPNSQCCHWGAICKIPLREAKFQLSFSSIHPTDRWVCMGIATKTQMQEFVKTHNTGPTYNQIPKYNGNDIASCLMIGKHADRRNLSAITKDTIFTIELSTKNKIFKIYTNNNQIDILTNNIIDQDYYLFHYIYYIETIIKVERLL